MPQPLKVELGDRSYAIHIGGGLLKQLGALIAPVVKGRTGLVVTDASVAALYGQPCVDALTAAGFRVGRAVVPAGESSKDGRWLFHLYEQAVEQGLDRQSFVVALGGGVVGAFHQPSLVVCDLDTLRSLPPREFVAGLAEVIKYGIIRDAQLFSLLEQKADALLRGDHDIVQTIVTRSCAIKAEVVGRDERESGLRAILNFGHTAGHALEAASGYGRYLHGEAIGVGMVFAAELSAALRGFPREECGRVIRLIRRVGLPVDASQIPWPALRRAIGLDKKRAAGKPRFVLADRLGAVTPGCEAPEDLLQQIWESKTGATTPGF